MIGGLGYLWFVIGGNTDNPLLILGIMFFACMVGLIVWLVGVLFAAILYRREQDKRWAEMEELLDIVDEATIVLHEQNRKDLAVRHQTCGNISEEIQTLWHLSAYLSLRRENHGFTKNSIQKK